MSCLYVTENGESPGASCEDAVFDVHDQLNRLSDREYDRIYNELSNADIDLAVDAPVYEIAWKHVIGHRKGRLHELVLVYRRLANVVEDRSPDRMTCDDDLDPAYRCVAEDVASAHGLPLDHGGGEMVSRRDVVQRFLTNTLLILPFLLDQAGALLWRRLFGRPASTDIVLVPYLGRLGSMLPLLQRLHGSDHEDHQVLVLSNASSLALAWKSRWLHDELDDFKLWPASVYSSLACLRRQLGLYAETTRTCLFGDVLRDALDDLLVEECDVAMDETLTYAIHRSFRTRLFISIFLYALFDDLTTQVDCEKRVTGGLDPGGKAMIAAGLDNNSKVYHVPHGIASNTCPNPPPVLNQFVSGELDERHYTESAQVEEPWNCIVTGRPYLTEMYRAHEETHRNSQCSQKTLRILIATQPFRIREEFVRGVLSTTDGLDADIVIKTHPSEDRSVYTNLVSDNDRVTVTEGGLEHQLEAADLTVAINSNVGLESIVVGTPTVSVNRWTPVIQDPIYGQYGPVPVFESREALSEFFGDLDEKKLVDLRETEWKFVKQNFALDVDAAANMEEALLDTPDRS